MIAIFDSVCPHPYGLSSAASGGLGGTEATVVRIAEGLGAHVYQHNRTEAEGRYLPMSALRDPDVLIVLRDPRFAFEVAERFPAARLVIWMHDLIEPGRDRAKRLALYGARLAARGATLVAVSDFHAAQIRAAFASLPERDRPDVITIYNPLREGLARAPASDVDPDRLVYFSAPVKGLDFALFVFRALRRRWPRLQLLVASPQYVRASLAGQDGVVALGSLSHADVMRHVSGALCAFCPNFEYPETFGLVLAESNAVGTPVLAHPIGAAPEVLADPRQLLDVPPLASAAFRLARRRPSVARLAGRSAEVLGGFAPFVDRLAAWRDGARPEVAARPEFAQQRVLAAWIDRVGAPRRRALDA